MVAYLVLSYTHPELVRRLVARLRGGLVAVHHDDRRCALGEVDALRIPPTPIEWGHGSQLAAILRCLRVLREHEWDWLVLLSGQDYPVRPRRRDRGRAAGGALRRVHPPRAGAAARLRRGAHGRVRAPLRVPLAHR